MPDFKSMARNDQIALGSGVLVFIASFLPWYGVKFSGGSLAAFGVSGSSTTDAWHGLAAFGLILSLLALAVTAAELLAKDSLPELPVSYPIVEAALASLGALFVIIKSFDLPSGGGGGVSVGLRWGGYILMVVILVQAVISVLRVVHSSSSSSTSAPPAPTI